MLDTLQICKKIFWLKRINHMVCGWQVWVLVVNNYILISLAKQPDGVDARAVIKILTDKS